jgi:nucleoside phosphorylase
MNSSTDSPILLISAIPGELKDIVKNLEPDHAANVPVYRGNLFGRHVCAASTGSGKVNAAAVLSSLISELTPKAVITAGVCASVNEGIEIGDIVEVHRCVQYDLNIGKFGLRSGEINGPLPRYITLEPRSTLKQVTAATADRFLDAAGYASYGNLLDELEADIVDMESYSWAAACRLHNIACTIFRIVSDTPSHSQKDFRKFIRGASEALRIRVEQAVYDTPSEKSPTIL